MHTSVVSEFCKMSDNENKTVRMVNTYKRSAIAEHLINNDSCLFILIF